MAIITVTVQGVLIIIVVYDSSVLCVYFNNNLEYANLRLQNDQSLGFWSVWSIHRNDILKKKIISNC